MHRVLPSVSVPWLFALGATVGLFALAASPSWLSPGLGYVVREAFALVCHQLPDRSPHMHGAQWALCFRWTGILGGIVLGLATGPWCRAGVSRAVKAMGAARLLLLMALPTTLDWLLGATGLWANTPLSRLTTGALLGLGAGWLLAGLLLRSTSSPSTQPAT
ncbi:MAG: DUF2085 domain-containing protein [Bacteroidota bacterium]